MSNYVGNIGDKINITLTLVSEYTFSTIYGEKVIYVMKDSEDNVFVWNTTSFLGIEGTDSRGNWKFENVNRGDSFVCKASIKEHSEYKGTKQTVIVRVKVVSISHVPTKAERDAEKAKEQVASLSGRDFIWKNMPYKQFKEHYSDCETVAGSFKRLEFSGEATIDVIIREGRLKNSGVRGQHFHGYQLKNNKGEVISFRAVCEENAIKQAVKMFGDHGWTCVKIWR